MTARALAPLPWRAGDYGMVEDANGNMVLRVATRLNLGDNSWLDLAAELAAAPDIRAALQALVSLIDRSEPRLQQTEVYRDAVDALMKARGGARRPWSDRGKPHPLAGA